MIEKHRGNTQSETATPPTHAGTKPRKYLHHSTTPPPLSKPNFTTNPPTNQPAMKKTPKNQTRPSQPQPAAVSGDSASPLNRELPHPLEPTAPCDLVAIAGYAHLVGRCPSCGYRAAHEPVAGVPLNYFSRRTCTSCGLPYWITSGDHMPFPRARRRKWIESSQKGKCRPVPLREFEKLTPPPA